MLAIGMLIDGVVDQKPETFHPYLKHSVMLAEANVVVLGTSCQRPLLIREGLAVANAVTCDLVISRASDKPGHATFDAKLQGDDRLFLAYRVWISRPTGTAWLIPSAGEGPCIRLEQDGLKIEEDPPYLDWADKYRGLEFGAEILGIAVAGWF
ncbi:hypothetical protein [Sphingomicrobium arenosum]|uniref:hypothetical protein n=1 Tax=Sphingomicrobium arenosum TaxID=2233861 RepID=UPI002240FB7D|nr:hypothetical protein [Sphingomicrobium arenosum]